MDPLVSIVIPVYNGANYLREAIDSALAQTYSNIEIIVVNDGSNDGGATRKIAKSYGDKIRYFEKTNGGVSTALNMGIKNMYGEYFSWLSHDDLYYPDKIQAQIDALRQAGDMSKIVYSNWSRKEMPKGTVTEYNGAQMYRQNFLETGAFTTIFGLVSGCSLLIPKIYFDAYGGFDETFRCVQDYKKWFELFRGKRLIYIRKSLIISRSHPQQTTHSLSGLMNVEEKWLYFRMLYDANENDICGSGLTDMYNFYCAVFSRWAQSKFKNAVDFAAEKIKSLPESPDTDERINKLAEFLNQGEYDTYFIKDHEIRIKLELALRGIVLQDDDKFVTLNQLNTLKSDKKIRLLDLVSLFQWLIDTPIKKEIFNRIC